MNKFKLFGVLVLMIMMTGCLGGGMREGKDTFTADGGTFNFFTMHIDFGKNFGNFNANANAHDIAMSNVPKGAKVTSVSACPTWEALTFPMNFFAFWNEHIFGYTGVQVGGTK